MRIVERAVLRRCDAVPCSTVQCRAVTDGEERSPRVAATTVKTSESLAVGSVREKKLGRFYRYVSRARLLC